MNTTRSQQFGFSLIELMISLAVSSVILIALVNVYSSLKQSSVANKSMVNMNLAGDVLFNTLGNDIQLAGFTGCTNTMELQSNNYVNASTSSTIDYRRDFIIGYDDVNATGWAGSYSWDFLDIKFDEFKYPKKGSDIIVLNRLIPFSGLDENPMVSHTTSGTAEHTIHVKGANQNLSAGTAIVVAGCHYMNIFTITNVQSYSGGNNRFQVKQKIDSDTVNRQSDLEKLANYASSNTANVNVRPFFAGNEIYYIGQSGTSLAGSPNYSLFKATINDTSVNTVEEMLTGAEFMQIQYGVVDSSGDINYQDSVAVANRHLIRGVKVAVVVASTEPVLPENNNDPLVYFGDQSYTPAVADKRQRKVIEKTFVIHNLIDADVI